MRFAIAVVFTANVPLGLHDFPCAEQASAQELPGNAGVHPLGEQTIPTADHWPLAWQVTVLVLPEETKPTLQETVAA
jgi:hypothetical protein